MSTGVNTFDNSNRDVADPAPVDVSAPLAHIRRKLAERPFVPHPLFLSGHAQTLAGFVWPRRFNYKEHQHDESRLFEVEPDVSVLARCRWQADKLQSPTVVLMHGLEGSDESIYILGTAHKAFRSGFNVVRLNLRTCGRTEHLTPTIYHSGLTGDILSVVRELVERDNLREIFLCGFSMSGNMSLRLAGENASELPSELRAICAVSPSVDVAAAADAIERRSNWLYQQSFMRSLRTRMRRKKKYFPELYDISDLRRVRTIRQFDERFTARHAGYKNADDYYARTSSFPVIPKIRVPTLIIHAEDDPFIPFDPLRDQSLMENPNLVLLAPPSGGHVGFVAADTEGEDRFWAENRIVEFFQLVHDAPPLS